MLLENVLADLGYPSFRGLQRPVIERVLAGGHALTIMPTGMGKSLCYQLPAKILPGLTLVISPLIALMKDQVDAARAKGFSCAFINSSLGAKERMRVQERLKQREFKLLYVTPERFRKVEFREALASNGISLLAIDEAHCISEWGHDFRPDYTRMGDIREQLGSPVTLALTATATLQVRNDILKALHLTEANTQLFLQGVNRDNLELEIRDVYGLDEKIRAMVAYRSHNTGPAIFYFSLIDTLLQTSSALQKLGVEHEIYHGQLAPHQRRAAQERFMKSPDALVLATPAFGLGVDKDNVRLVLHAEIPGSIEAYYQEIGRAGRDGNPALCVLLYDSDDVAIQTDFIKWSNPDPDFILAVYRLIDGNVARVNAEGTDFLRTQMNFYNRRDFRVETALNLLERWDCIEGSLGQRNLKPIEPPSGEFMDRELYKNRLKGQQEKLWQLIQLVKNEGDRKSAIYSYFGMPP